MKFVACAVGGFVLGIAVAVSLCGPRYRTDAAFVDYCRRRVSSVEQLDTEARRRVDSINASSPELRLQWRVINAVARVET